MRKYNWENFRKEEFFGSLCDFFNYDIFGNSKFNDNKKWTNVIFVSRKAYCLFLLLKSKKMIDENGCRVYSDRFVMKSLDKELFEGEKIVLVDDTVTTGRHMADIYNMIKRRTSAVQIIPVVFAADQNFISEYVWNTFIEKYSFQINYVQQWNSSNILRFCSIETLIMYQEEIPYTIELPTLNEENKHYISLSDFQFDKLKTSQKNWHYLECNESGYQQNNILYGTMVMEDNSIAEFLAPFIFRFCVRLQITERDNEKRIIAIPFAVLKSARYDELFQLFTAIYEGTSYYDAVCKYISECNNEDVSEEVYVAVYRGIVFNLSEYIGLTFIQYLKKEIIGEKKVSLQEYHEEHNFEKSFSESTKEIFNKHFMEYFLTLINFKKFTPIKRNNSLLQYISKFKGIKCDYRTVSLYLLALINEMRYRREEDDLLNVESEQKIKFVTIEELQLTLYETFPEEKTKYLNDILLMCICSMLGQSKLANEIFLDKKSNIVYRGFKYGENSEALLELSAKIFYIGVKEYYETVLLYHKDEAENIYAYNYESFLDTFMMFLYEYNLFGNVMTKDEFKIYAEMFRERNPEQLRESIFNKEFLGEDTKRPVYLENLQKYIRESDIYQ